MKPEGWRESLTSRFLAAVERPLNGRCMTSYGQSPGGEVRTNRGRGRSTPPSSLPRSPLLALHPEICMTCQSDITERPGRSERAESPSEDLLLRAADGLDAFFARTGLSSSDIGLASAEGEL